MKLLKNKEIQLSIGILLVLLITFGAVSMYFVKSFTNAVNTLQIKQNTAVIGAMVKSYPELENDIVKNYTKGFKEDYQYGRSILQKYSYDENTNSNNNPALSNNIQGLYIRIIIMTSFFSVILLIFFILTFSRLYKKIRSISTCAEAAVEGKYEPLEGDKEEGDISLLIYQFNCMTQRLSDNVQTLNEEKLYLKRLITDISHQLKTPLASLIMFNDIMADDTTLSEEDRYKFILESKNQLDRMEWLIKNMLKMAKLEAGVVDYNKEELYIADTLSRCLSALSHLADERNIKIKLTGCKEIKVRHDSNWTTEALSNVIKNCIEHSGTNKEINISWEENNVFVQIVIDDNGTGIPKKELPRIFDRFYKGPNSVNPTNVGIGLYITKTVIEGQGGSIYVNSSEGNGTKFIIRLMKLT